MSDIYIVKEYFGEPRWRDDNVVGFLKDVTTEEINEKEWSLLKVYAFKDKESAMIVASRIGETGIHKNHCVKINKYNLHPTDDSLRDIQNVYAVMQYRELLFQESEYFQDEINAEIHKNAIGKLNMEHYKTIKVPISPEVRLDNAGNFTQKPVFLDMWNRNNKAYKF